jgi:hypothetical protein
MQVANSAFFGVREQVTSVRRAISLLGFATVRTLALGFFFNEEFGTLRLPGLPYPDLPHFALSASVLAESIANVEAPTLAAEAACLGLLHESGVIIMAMTFGSHYRRMLRLGAISSGDLANLEMRTFGLNHPLAGQLLFESWRLGPDLAAAVAHHHRRDGVNDTAHCCPLWKILILADSLALGLLKTQPPAVQEPSEASLAPAPLSPPPAQADPPPAPTQEMATALGQGHNAALVASGGADEQADLARRLFGWMPEKLVDITAQARLMYLQRLAILGQPTGSSPDIAASDETCERQPAPDRADGDNSQDNKDL